MIFLAILCGLGISQEVLRIKNGSVEIISYPPSPLVVSEDNLAECDEFNVYIGEYVMNNWRGRTIWNLYHAGIAFEPVENSELPGDSVEPKRLYVLDYNAMNDEDIMPFIVPSSKIPGFLLRSLTLSEWISEIVNFYTSSNALSLQWENTGQLRLINTRPKEYTNFTFIGRVRTATFRAFRSWAVREWAQAADTFDLFTVVDPAWETYFLKARICHEFVEDAVAKLRLLGMNTASQKKPLFRDAIVLYASDVKPVDLSNWREVRDLARFLRIFAANWKEFSSSFHRASELAAKFYSIGLRGVVYSQGQLQWVHYTNGFLDYCYIERELTANKTVPPRRLCLAAGATADLSWRLGDWLMFLEIKLDDYWQYLATAVLGLLVLQIRKRR